MSNELDSLKRALNIMNDEYNKRLGTYNVLKEKKEESLKKYEELISKRDKAEIDCRLFKEMAKKARELGAELFCDIATCGLKNVISDNLSLVASIGEYGGIPTLDLNTRTEWDNGYITECNPADGAGGGVADVVSLSSFVAAIYLADNGNSAPLFLDEPIRFLSADYAPAAAAFIKSLSEQFGRQIIMVTHDIASGDIADSAWEFALDSDGRTQISIPSGTTYDETETEAET